MMTNGKTALRSLLAGSERVGYRALANSVAVAGTLAALASGAHAQTAAAPTLPDTTAFNGAFADTQTWSTNMVTGPGKYVIYIGLTFAGFRLVKSWINRTSSGH